MASEQCHSGVNGCHRSDQVGLDDRAAALEVAPADRRRGADAGIGDHDVAALQALRCLVDRPHHIRVVGDVELADLHPALGVRARDLRAQLLEGVEPSRGEEQVIAATA